MMLIMLNSNQIIIINKHHFNENVTLVIDDKGWKWLVPDKHDKIKILDPVNSLDDFVKLINIVFRFTGVSFCEYSGKYISNFDIKNSTDKKWTYLIKS